MLFFFEITAKPPLVTKYLLLLIAVYFPEFGYCQYLDSLEAEKPHRFMRSIAAPTAFIASGLIVRNHNEAIQRYFNQKVDERGPKGPGHISDYTQFAPLGLAFLLSAMHKPGEHKFLKQLSLAAQAEVLMIAMVRPLKYISHETRPDGGPNSFPSGHTAQAFMAATFLHKEFGHKSIWYSVAGYTMATAVGTCRMMSNRHWASDVLVGAGLGILSTNMVYLAHKHRTGSEERKAKGQGRRAMPRLNVSAAPRGFYMSMKL